MSSPDWPSDLNTALFIYRELCVLFTEMRYLPPNLEGLAPEGSPPNIVARYFTSKCFPWFNTCPPIIYREDIALRGAPYIALIDRYLVNLAFDPASLRESPTNGTYLLLVILMVHDTGHVASAQLLPADECAPRAFKCPADLPGDDPGDIMERSFFGGVMSVVCRDEADVQHLTRADILHFIMTTREGQRYHIGHDVARRWILEGDYKPIPLDWLSPAEGDVPLPNEYPCARFNSSVYSTDRFKLPQCPIGAPTWRHVNRKHILVCGRSGLLEALSSDSFAPA